jgi:hypothetical protein
MELLAKSQVKQQGQVMELTVAPVTRWFQAQN